MDEDVSTSYWNTTFHVEETNPNGDDVSVDRVSEVRKVYASNIEKSKYLYFIKVVISHPEVEVISCVISCTKKEKKWKSFTRLMLHFVFPRICKKVVLITSCRLCFACLVV